MNMRILLTTVFAIMLFAVAASAQNVVAFDSHGVGHQLSASRSSEAPMMLDALAGKPIKVVIHFAKAGKSTPILNLAPSKGKTFKILPCGPGESLAAGNATAKMEVYLQIELENTLISNYSISGNVGSCRLVSLRLANGAEYRAKLRFR